MTARTSHLASPAHGEAEARKLKTLRKYFLAQRSAHRRAGGTRPRVPPAPLSAAAMGTCAAARRQAACRPSRL